MSGQLYMGVPIFIQHKSSVLRCILLMPSVSNQLLTMGVIINFPLVDSNKISIGSSLRTQKNHVALSVADVNVIEDITVDSMPNKPIIGGVHQLIKEVSKIASKPRTALLKEGEDDEPIVHQNISASFSSSPYKFNYFI